MALHVYRFRREQPLASIAITSMVGAGVTFVASSAGVVLDLQADDTQADDLIALCAREGLVYVSTDPVTPPDADVLYPSSLTQSQHRTLRQLIHFIDEQGPAFGFTSGAFRETLPAGDPFPTSEVWYTDAAKTVKIVEEIVVYNPNKTIASDTWRMYSVDGLTVLETVVDTISYSSVFETSRVRAIS